VAGHDVNEAAEHVLDLMPEHVEIHVHGLVVGVEGQDALQLVVRQRPLGADDPAEDFLCLAPTASWLILKFVHEALDDFLVTSFCQLGPLMGILSTYSLSIPTGVA